MKSEEWKIGLTQLLNEECRMKNEEWELVLFSWVWLYKKPQSEERNPNSSFFIHHSSFSTEGDKRGSYFSLQSILSNKSPNQWLFAFFWSSENRLFWKRKEVTSKYWNCAKIVSRCALVIYELMWCCGNNFRQGKHSLSTEKA